MKNLNEIMCHLLDMGSHYLRPSKIQFLIFLIGGCASAFIDISATMLSNMYIKNVIYSATIGFFSSFLFNYTFHLKITFAAKGSQKVLIKFFAVVFINYLIMLSGIYLLTVLLGIHLMYSKLITLFIVAIVGFILAKRFVFI